MFELLTLIQTGKVSAASNLAVWKRLLEPGSSISRRWSTKASYHPTTSTSFTGARTLEEAWDFVKRFYAERPEPADGAAARRTRMI